ncbi:entry exclusion lipoprotein TrbK [Marinomonas ostreistagni]|uniref:entry exclusion lipoprotein TrbK n=1 Tax=Marinomonas ostreistagni TaxID=359209 RepID=UPI00195225C9|nr:entry exclusion lipoprotein TrbK [Marinomonas ostreistagni]MBM6550041.1 entry exclusion lipoprotein TrbK [Marinomonas ostreistagni]
MDKFKLKYIAGLFAVAAFTTACSEQMPEVNDENCTQANIQQIEDSQAREEFSDQCFDYQIEQGKEAAQELMDDSADAAEDAYDNTADAMEDGADAVGDAWDDSVDAIEEGADEAEDEVDQATN